MKLNVPPPLLPSLTETLLPQQKAVKELLASPSKYLESVNPKSVKDVIQAGGPSVALILKEPKGFEIVAAILVLLIEDLNLKSNVGKPMNDLQMNDFIALHIEKYPSAKIDHYVLAFKRIKTGEYGTFYGSIDGIVLGNMIKQFFDGVQEEVVSANLANNKLRVEESKEQIKLPDGEVNYPPVSEWFKPKQSEIKPSKPREMSEEQRLFNDFLKRFDWLYSMAPVEFDKHGKELKRKFINRYGRIMDVQDFINYKADQYMRVIEYLDKREAA